ncbi:MAG: MoaD/ThiS family protein [Myxococcota bacterium]|jgi:molybdopterin converting factor small subunit|nr:MoaD/ThiS family protein [Myxococcota bacterium]
MSITVQLTYDMAREVGSPTIQVSGAETVSDVLKLTRERFSQDEENYAQLTRVAALAINGVLINYRRGKKTKVQDGDRVSFVKAAAGG